MEKKVLLISCAVGFLGLLSAATGFGAEGNRIKGSEVEFISATQCEYPRSPAMALGLTAAIALMVAKIIINASTGCICCKRNTQPLNSNWKPALKQFQENIIPFLIFVVRITTFVLFVIPYMSLLQTLYLTCSLPPL
ncbi:hypothetical protein UlMin_024745 [Ulmus minor]